MLFLRTYDKHLPHNPNPTLRVAYTRQSLVCISIFFAYQSPFLRINTTSLHFLLGAIYLYTLSRDRVVSIEMTRFCQQNFTINSKWIIWNLQLEITGSIFYKFVFVCFVCVCVMLYIFEMTKISIVNIAVMYKALSNQATFWQRDKFE